MTIWQCQLPGLSVFSVPRSLLSAFNSRLWVWIWVHMEYKYVYTQTSATAAINLFNLRYFWTVPEPTTRSIYDCQFCKRTICIFTIQLIRRRRRCFQAFLLYSDFLCFFLNSESKIKLERAFTLSKLRTGKRNGESGIKQQCRWSVDSCASCVCQLSSYFTD